MNTIDGDFAVFLAASWKLVKGDQALPIQSNAIDRALQICVRNVNVIPEQFRGKLTFVNSRIGVICPELHEALQVMCYSWLASYISPQYTSMHILIAEDSARRLLKKRGFTKQQAIDFGTELSDSFDRMRIAFEL